MKRSANDNQTQSWNQAGLWLVCDCGCDSLGMRLDEKTGLLHAICKGCGTDRSTVVFS